MTCLTGWIGGYLIGAALATFVSWRLARSSRSPHGASPDQTSEAAE